MIRHIKAMLVMGVALMFILFFVGCQEIHRIEIQNNTCQGFQIIIDGVDRGYLSRGQVEFLILRSEIKIHKIRLRFCDGNTAREIWETFGVVCKKLNVDICDGRYCIDKSITFNEEK